MSTIKTTYIQHPSSGSPNIELAADGTVYLPGTAITESVNGETGVVTLDTDDVSEGTGNLYYTDARADGRIAAASVADLSDVSVAGIVDGQLLVWDDTSGELVPATLSDLIQALDLTSEDL